MSTPTLFDLFNSEGILDDDVRSKFNQALYNTLPDIIKSLGFKSSITRAEVVAIDFKGGTWGDSPRNSIKANVQDGEVVGEMIFFPALDPFIQLPLKIGETVYVLYETDKSVGRYAGVWFCRVVEPLSNQSINYVNSADKFNDGISAIEAAEMAEIEATSTIDPSTGKVVYDTPKPQSNSPTPLSADSGDVDPVFAAKSSMSVYEAVPRFMKRGDDLVLMGSNNNMIVLQVDRPGDRDSGLREGAGAIDIVCGRGGQRQDAEGKQITGEGNQPKDGISRSRLMNELEGEPDFVRDRARNYMCMKCDGDTTFTTTSHLMKTIDGEITLFDYSEDGGAISTIPSGDKDEDASWDDNKDELLDRTTEESSFVIAKSDCIRHIARHSVKIESLNQARVVDENTITTNDFSPTTNTNDEPNIGSSIVLNPDGIILIETQNKKGMIRIDPNSAESFIDISIKDLPQHDPAAQTVGSIIMKADGTVTVDSKVGINLGNGATEHAVLGDKLVEFLENALTNHIHPTGVGPSGPSNEIALESPNFKSFLSKNITIKEDLTK